MPMHLTGVITLNGVTYNYTLEAVAGAPAGAPGSNYTTPFRRQGPGEEVHTVSIVSHAVKSGIISKGKRRGQPYELHTFKGSDNKNYITFEPEVASELSPNVGSTTPVKITGYKDDRGSIKITSVG